MNWEKIIIGVLVGAIGVLSKPVQRAAKKFVEAKLRRNHTKVFERKVAINAMLKVIEEQNHVMKAVLVQTKNGGGVPRVNTPIYASIVLPLKHSESLKGQLLDTPFCEIITLLISSKSVRVNVNELPDQSILKDLMQAENITHCMFFDAYISKHDYNFIQIGLDCDPDHLEAEVRNTIRQQVTDIIKLVNV